MITPATISNTSGLGLLAAIVARVMSKDFDGLTVDHIITAVGVIGTLILQGTGLYLRFFTERGRRK